MQLEDLYKLYLSHPTVTTDSRDCPPGSIFFALRGGNFDGNAYASKAIAAGCAYAVVDRPEFAPKGDARYIAVGDALQTMQDLARLHRETLGQRGLKVIQITGTNGKTTTKELVSAVLARKYSVLHTEGNLNNHIGVPKTLLRLTAAHEVAVVETGANHRGEIAQLTSIVHPDYGIVTNVGRAHLEGFGSFEGVVRTKAELYDYLRTKPGAATFLNNDSDILRKVARGITAYRYGTTPAEGLTAEGRLAGCDPYVSFEWRGEGEAQWHSVATKLIGGYNIANLLAAVSVGIKFGVDAEDICAALEEYTPSNNRSQLRQTAANTLIIDAYNANPTSMHAALDNFASLRAANKMVILGEMRELGPESADYHQRLLDFLARAGFARVWLIGANFESLRPQFTTFHTVDDAIAELREHPLRGYTILIKGSNSNKLYRLPDYL